MNLRLINTLCIFTILIFQGCSSSSKKNSGKYNKEIQYSNFDKVSIPNEAPVISKMISVVQPELEQNKRNLIANQISNAIKMAKTKIEPQIMVAIIDTESNFKSDKVSTTGDLSLAQVNVEVWNRELARMRLELINVHELKNNQAYSLRVMAQILGIIKERYGKKDRRWYARYHSKTSKHKSNYLNKLEIRMKMLQSAPLIASK